MKKKTVNYQWSKKRQKSSKLHSFGKQKKRVVEDPELYEIK